MAAQELTSISSHVRRLPTQNLYLLHDSSFTVLRYEMLQQKPNSVPWMCLCSLSSANNTVQPLRYFLLLRPER